MKILIVDDSLPMRRLIKYYLQQFAPTVVECDDGSDALRLFTQNRPDWVLMDIQMKDVDGFAATRQILEKYPDAKVVIVSQHDTASLRDEARSAGACAYVSKVDLTELGKVLR